MLSTNRSPDQAALDADVRFELVRGQLRLALVHAIARRVGKSIEPVSMQEARSEVALAELYRRKLRYRFSEAVERLLFRWWRQQ
jgi:hypothetical protein